MDRPSGWLQADNRRLRCCIGLTVLLALLLIAVTVWVYQRRIQRLRQQLNESPAPAASSLMKCSRCYPADQRFSFLSFPAP